MPTYIPYEEDEKKPEQVQQQGSVSPSTPSSKYIPYDPETPATKEQTLAILSQPREPWAGTYMTEATKGAARGLVGMAKAFGEGLYDPSKSTVPENMRPMQHNEDIAKLKGMFDEAMKARPDASTGEKAAGFAGEVAGGMFLPGAGGATGSIKGALGPGMNSLAIPGLTGITKQFPVVAKGAEEATGGGLFSDMLSNTLPKELADIGMKMLNVPRVGRYAARAAWGALRNKMMSGSEPSAALMPADHSQMMRRMSQGAVTPLYADDQ